jgi:hypothetical protein
LPKEEGLTKKDFGQCATRSDGVIWWLIIRCFIKVVFV